MLTMLVVLAYFSPETMLPLSSVIATVVGFGLLIKRSSIRFVVHCFRAAIRRGGGRSAVQPPHFDARARQSSDSAAARR